MIKAAKTVGAMLAMSAALGAAVYAPAAQAQPTTVKLVATDTTDAYPFAAIAVGNTVYHVTEGDVLEGLHIRRITPGRVTLSDNQVLVLNRTVALR